MFSSHDGRFLYVSRPSFADVVGIDLATEKIVWRTKVEGYRADHMRLGAELRDRPHAHPIEMACEAVREPIEAAVSASRRKRKLVRSRCSGGASAHGRT